MEQINNHSPLPWEHDKETDNIICDWKGEDEGDIVAQSPDMWPDSMDHYPANASFIVTACNSYYQSQETISSLTERVKELEAEREWISVNERLPEKGTTVLTYIQWSEDTDTVVVQYDKDGNWYGRIGAFVTHWMKLPESPRPSNT